MSTPRILHLYLNAGQRAAAASGAPRMVTRVKEAVEGAGWAVVLMPESAIDAAPGLAGYHLVVNQPVPGPNCLTLRSAGFEPFWRIEATNDRWDWPIARQSFAPPPAGDAGAGWFLRHWRGKVFGDRRITREGVIFVPLQGRLTQRRSFQSASPVEMLQTVLTRWPGVPVRATLHPAETYTEAEFAALDQLEARHSGFRVETLPSLDLLARCNLVVTENSTLALKGFLAEKPALLFAASEFHHIAASARRDGPERALVEAERDEKRPYAAYLHWFLRETALNQWAEDLTPRVLACLRGHGWPI